MLPSRNSDQASDPIERVAAEHAERIATRAAGAPAVHIAAPIGFGKTEIATRIAHSSGRTVAWCALSSATSTSSVWSATSRSLLVAWPDAPNQPDDVSNDNAQQLVLSTLGVVGPTTFVFDDVDGLDPGVLDSVVEMLSAADSTQLIVTSQHGPTPGLTLLEAAGRLAHVDADELAFSVAECVRMVGSDDGHELHQATGGWPVAVLVKARALLTRKHRRADDSLLQLFAGSHPDYDRGRLAVAALLDRFSEPIIDWVRVDRANRRDSVAENLLFQSDGASWSIRQWAREALADEPLNQRDVDDAIHTLRRTSDAESWLSLSIATGRTADALPEIEAWCAHQIATGGHQHVRRLIDRIAPEVRTVDLRISAVLAEQATSSRRPLEAELRHLVGAGRAPDGAPSPRANAALANHLRMVNNPEVIEVCHEVVAPLVELEPGEAALLAQSLWAGRADRIAAAELLRFLGQGTMLSAGAASFSSGRRMIESAFRILDDEQSVTSGRGWLLYIETLLFVARPADVVLTARTIALELWRARHSDAALRLSELAMLEFFAGRFDRARSTIELAREASAESGSDVAAIPLAGLECGLDVIDDPESNELIDAFEHAIFALLDHDYLAGFHQLFAAEFGLLQLRLGNRATAARFSAIAEQSPTSPMSGSFSLRRRRLQALVFLDTDRERGRAALTELRDLAQRLHRSVLVELIDCDLDDVVDTPRPDDIGDDALHIIALAPALCVMRGGHELPAPRGFSARLLALLIASSGVVALDVALEELWPDSDPQVSRNRLHGVLLRLRRALGFGPDGPLTCRDDLIRLAAGPSLSCDVWTLESDIASNAPVGRVDDVLSEQFRYDDRISRYREHIRRIVERSASLHS